MASRNQKQRRKRRRRRGRGGRFLLALLCIAMTAAGILTAVTVFFKISKVEVKGDTRYEQTEILKASGIAAGKNMFFFNKFSVISQMFERFPYLSEITIRRRLPDTVEITVSDCVPAAVIEAEEKLFLVDDNGKLLEEVKAAPKGICVVRGIAPDRPKPGKTVVLTEPDKEKPLQLLLNTFRDNDIIKQVGEVDFSRGFDISFTYLGRFTVRIGTTENLDKKLDYLRVIVEENLAQNQKGVIDVSDLRTARFIPE